jgi:hypothetical protein
MLSYKPVRLLITVTDVGKIMPLMQKALDTGSS